MMPDLSVHELAEHYLKEKSSPLALKSKLENADPVTSVFSIELG